MIRGIEEIKDTLEKFLETRLDLIQYEMRDKLEKGIVLMVYAAIAGAIGLATLILALMLLAGILNQLLESWYAGYLILFLFFLVLLIACLLFRKAVRELIRKALTGLFNKEEAAG